MNFGRQLLPVKLEITGGEPQDRDHWARIIERNLMYLPCAPQRYNETGKVIINIFPDANND